MCRSKTVHECDLFIGVAKNEGEDEVSVKLVIEYSHAVKVMLDIYKTHERDPQVIKPTNAILTAFGETRLMSCVVVNSSADTRSLFLY